MGGADAMRAMALPFWLYAAGLMRINSAKKAMKNAYLCYVGIPKGTGNTSLNTVVLRVHKAS